MNIIKSKLKYFILPMLMVVACGAPKQLIIERSFKIKNIKEAENDLASTLMYTLPKTKYKIQITVRTTYFKKGPYAKYSKKYLNITVPKTKNFVKSEMVNINVVDYSVPDYEHTYSIQSEGLNSLNYINLSNSGLIKCIGSKSLQADVHKDLSFSDLPISRNGMASLDEYFRSLPFVKRQVNEVAIAAQAKETAKLLKTIRKRRTKMLTGKYKILLPDGKAFEMMMKETEKIEDKYMSLFVGKSISYVDTYTFVYEPSKTNLKKTLCYFDTKKGIVSKKSKSTKEIVVESFVDSAFDNMKNTVADGSGLIYRTPAQTEMKIKVGDKDVFYQSVLIPQLGTLLSIPQEVLLQDNLSIEFDQNSGVLRSITPTR